MPKMKLLLLLAFIVAISFSLSISSVSLQNPTTSSGLYGSIMGGTKLYIEGLGFSPVMDQNHIFVGDYPCDLEDGATATTILCITRAPEEYRQYWSQPITVIVDGLGSVTYQTQKFAYVSSHTPELGSIYPAVSYGGGQRKLYLYGRHRIYNLGADKDLGSVYAIYVGKSICSRFGIFQAPIPDLWSWQNIHCYQPSDQQAGKYTVTEHLFPGRSRSIPLSFRTSFDNNEKFNFVVLPLVNQTTQRGSNQGNELNIKGTGFSLDKSKVKVSVDGTECKVSESTTTEIKCTLEPKVSQTAILSTNAETPANQYNSGSGFFYKRYNVRNLSPRTISKLKQTLDANSMTGLTLIEQYIAGQIKSPDVLGQYYGQVWKGYFVPTKTGNHVFRGVGDDTFAIYLSKDVYGSTVALTEPIAFADKWTPTGLFSNYYTTDYPNAESTPIALQAGKQYYMEVYHINGGGQGTFSLSVQIPNNDVTIQRWQTYEVQTIQTKIEEDPEIIDFNSKGVTSGTLNIRVKDQNKSTLEVIRDQNITIPWNAGATAFCNQLRKFAQFGDYSTTCTVTMKTATGEQTQISAQAVEFTWHAAIAKLRPDSARNHKYNPTYSAGSGQFTMTTAQQHSPPLSGTFTLSIGGAQVKLLSGSTYTVTDIPYNVGPDVLRSALRQIQGLENTEVDATGDYASSAKWIVYFIGYNKDLPLMQASTAGLAGGKATSSPSVQIKTRRQYSSDLLIDPIDYRFMKTYSDKPSVIVTVNGIDSACNTDCRYTFISVAPKLQSLSLSGNTLSIGLSDPESINLPLDDITVTLDNQPCGELSGTMTSFTCTIPKNADNSAVLTAGSHYPVINIKDVGYAVIDKAVNPITVNLEITALDVALGSANGGYDVKVTGKGFVNDPEQITFKVCSKQCTIGKLANTEATITIPSCDTAATDAVVVEFNQMTANKEFTLTAATDTVQINSISPTSWSPVMKGVMEINGQGFGTDLTQLQVVITNSTGNVYKMKILQATDTKLKVGIPGGFPGKFKVNVIKTGFGNAVPVPETANDFAYEVYISGISPSSGSIAGGTLLAITGKNFVPDPMQTMITIGNELNQFCVIETITSTQIKCRTPAMNPLYTVDTPLEVTVDSKLIIPTNCTKADDPCWFSYKSAETSPTLTSLSNATLVGNGELILTGTGFDLGTSAKASLTNMVSKKVTVFEPNAGSLTATSMTINLANLESGYYAVRARMDPLGQTNPLTLTLHLNVTAWSTSSMSVNGGQLTITGIGLPQTWPNTHYNKIGFSYNNRNFPLQIIQTSTTKMVVKVPKGADGRVYKFSIRSPTGHTTSKSITLATTSTPSVNLLTPTTIPANTATTINLNRVTSPTTTPQKIELFSVTNPQFVYPITSGTWTYSSTQIQFSVTLNTGKYGFRLYDETLGWYATTATSILEVSKVGTYTVVDTVSSFNGGVVTVTGSNIGNGAIVKVAGQVGKLIERSDSSATFAVPKLVTKETLDKYKFEEKKVVDLSGKVTWGDTAGWENAFDKDHATIYTSKNSTCAFGVDIGDQRGVKLNRVRFFSNPAWQIASQYVKGAKIQASTDNTTWTKIAQVDQTVHAGWNTLMIIDTKTYRYIRFSHTDKSQCNISQLQLTGIAMNTITVADTTSFKSDLIFDDGANTQTFASAIEYRDDSTPIVTGVTPDKGDVFGNYDITLTGTSFDKGTPKVIIDGVECVVGSSTATQIVCKVGERKTLPNEVKFDVRIGGMPAIIEKKFIYVMRWSDPRTWGTDLPPIQNDLVYVPKGMHLLVDQSTPRLEGIIVQNATLSFSDQKDIQVHTGFIIMRGGQFIAGTQEKPYTKQLRFVMYGSYYGKQLPMFGNKGIGCMECKFTMHGEKRIPTWTTISATIEKGVNTFTTSEDVDWKVGETIVVASTSYDHNEAEMRVITGVSGRTITVDKSFRFKHLSVVDTYGSDKIQMRAEVALLSRNIKMMGDETSVATDYGSHLMLAGSAQNGMVGKIAYVEFTKCGQPQIVGRYCHHFHMNGDVPDSYSIGNSVHHSMARILTIHGVHYLYVAKNVGYRVKGHNFFIQDGIQTNNILEYNLAIGSLQVNNMLQTDMSVASFWVTNPTNILRYNNAAGSDFYGIWYEIKQHPDGPSATEDICPIGNPLGQSHDNIAHSNVRFGLRIFQMYARQDPCKPIRNDSLEDPWSDNPSIQSRFYNYVLWKNGEAGLLAQQTGNMLFENFTIAESKMAGMEFYKANFTKEHTKARNIAIIGRSTANPPAADTELDGSKGVILPRTGEVDFEDIRFYEFTSGMTVWQSCSKCDNLLLYTNFGATYWAEKISYTNINGNFYHMLGLKKEVFYDKDGTLTNGVFDSTTRTSATLTFGWPHLLQDIACVKGTTPTQWDNGAVCDQTVTLRQVMFTNLMKTDQFRSVSIKSRMLAMFSQVTQPTQTQYTSSFSLQNNMQPTKQMKFTYSLPYIIDRIYNIWFGTGINFDHMAMVTSSLYGPTQKATLFKFNYTLNRELYEIAPLRQGTKFNYNLLKTASADLLNSDTCGNGDYYHNNADDQRVLELCASGKNRSTFEYVDVNAVYCRFLCPAPPGRCTKEKTLRYWNNATQWPNGVMPSDGDNITIPCEWTVMMDISPARIYYFEISGDIIIPDTQDITISADNIWIKGGSLKAGTKDAPFTHKLTIQLKGLKDDLGFTVSPDLTGKKMLVNTGRLQLFGTPPATTWTRLTAFADKGATSITVDSATGWAVGDEIGIAPSFMTASEFQKVTITAISSKTITFTPALKYSHFGDAAPTIVRTYGTMDMRAGVGHLTRNIKITAGDDAGWGFHVTQFGYTETKGDDKLIWTGNMTLVGVEFVNGGQYDTEVAALEIVNIRRYTEHTLVTKSSFHDCQDFCLRIDNAYNLEITNNVFFHAKKFHVRALDIFDTTFSNNLMIGVLKRQTMAFTDLIACFASYKPVDPSNDAITVTGNLCQGSDGNGYAVPDVACDDIDLYPFAGNTAGSCDIGWIFARGPGSCLASKGVYAYGSQIGTMQNPPDTVTVKFKNFILADNVRSMTIRIGGASDEKYGYVYDSYITAIARPTCTKCYGTGATPCVGSHGVRMLTTGTNGQKLPDKFGHGFDVVCKEESIDGKVFIYNTVFDNFRKTYTSLPQCSKNVVFRPHTGGGDFTACHNLFDTQCTNCQQQAWAYFDPPNQGHRGWFGGCGQILCTGNNNYFIHDYNGTFLPTKGILLANNSWIGDNTPSCKKISDINGHYCTDEDFGVLEYESVAPDFNKRIMWPVYLKYDGGNWTTETNGWREWAWNGGQPLNKRLGRFVSVIKLSQMYNMTFVSMPPEDMTFKLQKRLPNGNPSDWIIVKLYYPKPNSIRVEVGGKVIKPIQLKQDIGDPLNTSVCGSNKFYYKNYTIHFVVTGDPACKVRVTLTNSVQLTAKFDMNIDDFYKDDGITKFVNRMCALLNIVDTSRVKVVGVYNGSVTVITAIEPVVSALGSSTQADTAAQAAAVTALNNQVQSMIASGSLETAMKSEGFGGLLSVSSAVTEPTPVTPVTPVTPSDPSTPTTPTDPTSPTTPTDPTTPTTPTDPTSPTNPNNASSSTTNVGLVVGLVVGLTGLACVIIIGVVCYMRQGVQIRNAQKLGKEDNLDSGSFNNESEMMEKQKLPTEHVNSAYEFQKKDLQ